MFSLSSYCSSSVVQFLNDLKRIYVFDKFQEIVFSDFSGSQLGKTMSVYVSAL